MAPAAGRAQRNAPGLGDSAVPQIVHVGVPVSGLPEVGVSATGHYGYTEPVESGDGDHHRLGGSVAASVRPFEWGSIWLRADGRYDMHPEDAFGQDDGLLGVPSAGIRAGGSLSDLFALGGEFELWIPGRDAPSLAGTAITFEARLLAALTLPDDGLTVAAMAGFRFDNSGNSVRRPVDLRRGDRIALGVSDYHAIVAGVGVSYRLDMLELLGEVSLDALLDVADFGTSPIRADLGARLHLTDVVAVELGGEVVMSGRPSVALDAPLVPIEPRVTVRAALRIAIPLGDRPTDELVEEEVEEQEESEEEATSVAATGQVRGRLLDDAGAPVVGARVVVAREGAEPIERQTDEAGSYLFEEVPVGPATVTVEAEGYVASERAITVTPGEATSTDTTLEAAMPSGQLRGMIRSFDGSPLEARVLVEDLEIEAQSDAEGYFEIDVPPGTHTVVIEAAGHRPQRREVDIPENGVTVLNADLRRGRGRRGR